MQLSNETKAIFRTMREGVLFIDTEANIVFANQRYLDFLHTTEEEITGRPLTEIRPGARLPAVLKTGQPILHAPRQEAEDEDIYFVNMYPVFEDGRVVGGLSLVTFMDDAFDFRKQLEIYEKRSKTLLHRVSRANGARYTFEDITAVSPVSCQTKLLAQRIAATDATVLLEAESGTGKELYAQSIHNASARQDGVFVAINCSNFNANTLESELFGYAEGAFTGAKKGGKLGLFEAANGGTLFLDEISEMDIGLQSKLLRVLQERRVRPVGSVREADVDVRVIAACNADLPAYIAAGKFRRDLYYRLAAFPIHIPPLRERIGDIPPLTNAILAELSHKLRRSIHVTDEAMDALCRHSWPGNVRELRNVLEFSAYLSQDGVITREALPQELVRSGKTESVPLAQRVRDFERHEISKTLERCGATTEGKRRAAAELGISLASLYNKLSR